MDDGVKNSKVNTKGKTKQKLMNCRREILISTMNMRTISAEFKRKELAYQFTSKGLSVLGIQDHKIVHTTEDDKIRTEIIDGCTLITTSAWRNDRHTAVGGVGLMMNKYAADAVADVVAYHSRIIIAHFSGNPSLSVIIQYSPTEGSDDAEEHYTNLASAISTIPKHNVLLVLGDFNAHLGTDDVKYSYHKKSNTNGQLLIDLSLEGNLIITNTSLRKRPGKLWTYLSDMTGSKTQIDYILINKKWKNLVKNVEAYSSFSSLGSDHRIVTARLKLSLRTSKTLSREKQYDWKVLRSDSEIQSQYTILVRNRFEELYSDSQTATEKYQHLIDANGKAADKLIPEKKRKKKTQSSKDVRIKEKREEVNKAFSEYKQTPTSENQERLQIAKTLLQETYEGVEAEELESMIQQVERADARSSHSESWKLINEISGRKNGKKGRLKGDSKESRIQSWYTQFSQLY